MKAKRLSFLLAAGLALLVLSIINSARAQGQNLLQNPGFEGGHFNQDNIAEITVPNGWRMHWSNGESQIFNGYAETARPETVVWNISGAPPAEKDVFWKDGIYTVKIFKGWAPLWAAMSQDVSGLEVGRRYRLVAPVYIDIVADYQDGRKVPPDDPRQGRVRLGASPVGAAWRDEGAINYSGWWTAETISPFYQAYPTFIHEFTATAPQMTVWIEVASNYPHPNNGFFIDTVGLYALDEVQAVPQAPAPAAPAGDAGAAQPAAAAQPAGPTATPLPTPTPRADGAVVHVVQSGDSFWSLAIQYAPVMGMTPEEALTAIPELNNNPSVINSGDELIIVPPNENAAPAPAEATAETPEEGEDAAAAEEAPADEVAEAAADTEAVAEDAAEAPADEANATGAEADGGEAVTEESAIARALPQVTGASVCVQAFEDLNGDGTRNENETPVADNAITVSRAGNTISTYITDGSSDAHCFENLEPDTYQVQIYPPADYQVTSDDSWAVAVAEGVMVPVSFSLEYQPAAVAAPGADGDVVQTADTAAAEAPEAAVEAPSGPSNLTWIIIGVAIVLVLIAGAGVYLLRRG